MQHGLISLLPLQIARLLGLVRSIEPAQIEASPPAQWVLLVRGRGFTRILRDEPLASPNLMRPAGWNLPRPMCFPSRTVAMTYGQSIGLLPRRATWPVKGASDGSSQ